MASRGPSHPATYTFDVRPGIGALRGAITNGKGPKAFILLVRFYDAKGEMIPGPYLRFSSSRFGAFRYLAGGRAEASAEFTVPLVVPDKARRLDAIFCGWASDLAVDFARPLEASGSVMARLPDLVDPPPLRRSFSPSPAPAFPGSVVVCEGTFESGPVSEVEIVIAPGEGDGEKAHLLVVECLDSAGKIINARLPGFQFATTTGNSIYVSFDSTDEPFRRVVQVHSPEGATAYRVLLKRWRGKGTPRLVSVDQRAVLGYAAQVELVTNHVNTALQLMESKYDSIIMITATTKAIEAANRINRPQALVQEFARQGFLVFYVYHRYVNTEPLPERMFDGIVQLPNDIFQILAPRIARTQAKRFRISLFSIPDHNSVRQLGVFQRFGWRTIYEVRDDWEAFAAVNVGRWYSSLWERFMTTGCDRTICVSPALMSKMMLFGCSKDKASLSHNATTSAFIKAAEPYRNRRTTQQLTKRRPVLGYFGHLTEAWFDWPLMAQAAAHRPDWDFEVIGFGAPKALAMPPNVMIKDAVPPLELPHLSQHWDIALIPFLPGPLSRAVDPIKIYDYQALGLPTLSVPMSLIHLLDNVHIYGGLDDFLIKADALVARLSVGPLEWRPLLSDHTWTARAMQIIEQSAPPRDHSARSRSTAIAESC
jgi:hypothetical protein